MLILWKGWNIEHKHHVMLWFIAYVLYDKDIFRNLSKIYGGAFLLEKSTVIFAKKLYYHRSLTGSSIRLFTPCTKMKFSIEDFFSKCYQINRKLRIWSCLLKKSLMENFIFCALTIHTILSFFCLLTTWSYAHSITF